MPTKKLTREETLLLKIGQATENPVDAIAIGKKLGLSEKNLKLSLHLLTHGNCIKRLDNQYVEITNHGKAICKHLQ
jgi:hypothetical protein